MAAPSFSLSDFRSALLRLLPTGPIWSREPGSMLHMLASVWAPTFQRNGDRAGNLLVDSFPSTSAELLPEWESTLGLPDPCAGTSPTVAVRRAQVVARLTDNGGSSIQYYTDFAQSLGYSIEIMQFAPARAGLLRAGDPLNAEAWAFAWRVMLPGYTLTQFRADKSAAGEPLASWGNAVLQCEIRSRAPAHTIVQFGYSAPFLSDFGEDIG